MVLSEIEHDVVWLGRDGTNIRRVPEGHGLSRYFDIHLLPGLILAESGWDQTNRCGYDKWLGHLPVCLNSILYHRERQMAEAFGTLEDKSKADFWEGAASIRREAIHRLMWNQKRKFFADYDWVRQKRDGLPSLAMFYPLWAGLATQEQADQMVRHWLPQFESKGGLVTTLDRKKNCQWGYPNGWAPLQMLVTEGLDQYGFTSEANRIRTHWLDMCVAVLSDTGQMWEKYNIVDCNTNVEPGLYKLLPGFGWTIAACLDFAARLAPAATPPPQSD